MLLLQNRAAAVDSASVHQEIQVHPEILVNPGIQDSREIPIHLPIRMAVLIPVMVIRAGAIPEGAGRVKAAVIITSS